jgi:ferredoxin
MKVRVDLDRCQSHGECCFVAPEVFELDADDVLRWIEEPDDAMRERIELAASVCPVQAITLDR